MADFLKGRGYVFHGQWLGTDASAFNEVEVRRDDVSLIERHPKHAHVFLRNGTSVIFLEMVEVTDPPPIIDATPVPTFESRKPKGALTTGKKKGK